VPANVCSWWKSGHAADITAKTDFDPKQTSAAHPFLEGSLSRYDTRSLTRRADMRRRDFLRCLGGVAATWPLPAGAQQTTSRTIGWFSLRSADTDSEKSILTAFRQGLSQTGYVEGRNLTIEFGFADGQYDRLPGLAADLVRRRVEVLVTAGGTNITRVAQAATTTIPIIFATANDPVQDGLVKSINRPGGNSTGAFVLNTALLPKRFELLRQLLPNARLVGFLVNPNGATTADQIRHAQSAGRTLALELLVLNAATPTEIDAAFGSFVQHGVDGLVMGNDPFFQVRQDQVIALAARHRIPTIYEWSEFVRAGGLAAYSTDRVEIFRQMGIYVSRILNGARPADLPIMQPTKFELVINVKTAGSLGLKLTEGLQQLADEVIE
jgi:putative ABC transport system substrate-binding protein